MLVIYDTPDAPTKMSPESERRVERQDMEVGRVSVPRPTRVPRVDPGVVDAKGVRPTETEEIRSIVAQVLGGKTLRGRGVTCTRTMDTHGPLRKTRGGVVNVILQVRVVPPVGVLRLPLFGSDYFNVL